MKLVGSPPGLAPVAANVVDTATTTPAPQWGYRRHGPRGIVAGVVCLVVTIYLLWLATRVVRAIEKAADKFQGRAP